MENVKSAIEQKLEKKTLSQVLAELQQTVEYSLKLIEHIDKQDLNTLLRAFKLLRENRELLDSIHKVVDAEYDRLSKHVIPEVFESMEIDSIKMHGRNFILGQRKNYSINNLDRDGCLNWLKDNGLGSLIKEDVNSRTLTSSLNELLESDAKTPPQGLFNFHEEDYIQVRKA